MNPENISIGVFALTIPKRFRDFGASLALSSGIILLPHSPLLEDTIVLVLVSLSFLRLFGLDIVLTVAGKSPETHKRISVNADDDNDDVNRPSSLRTRR
jgi:hypothetical protein